MCTRIYNHTYKTFLKDKRMYIPELRKFYKKNLSFRKHTSDNSLSIHEPTSSYYKKNFTGSDIK